MTDMQQTNESISNAISQDRARWSQVALNLAKEIIDSLADSSLTAETVAGHLIMLSMMMRSARVDEAGAVDNIANIEADARIEGFNIAMEAVRTALGIGGQEIASAETIAAIESVAERGYFGALSKIAARVADAKSQPEQQPVAEPKTKDTPPSRIVNVFTRGTNDMNIESAMRVAETLDWTLDTTHRRNYDVTYARIGDVTLNIETGDGGKTHDVYVWHSNQCGAGDLARSLGLKCAELEAKGRVVLLLVEYLKPLITTINAFYVNDITKMFDDVISELSAYRDSEASTPFGHFLSGIPVGAVSMLNMLANAMGYSYNRGATK